MVFTLFYGTVYDVTDGTDSANGCVANLTLPGMSQGLQQWRDAYVALAKDSYGPHLKVVPVDLLELFYGHGFHYADETNEHFVPHDPTLWLSEDDCIHPNNRGHHELAQSILPSDDGTQPPGQSS